MTKIMMAIRTMADEEYMSVAVGLMERMENRHSNVSNLTWGIAHPNGIRLIERIMMVLTVQRIADGRLSKLRCKTGETISIIYLKERFFA
jgi:hypothetical protein